VYAKGGWWGWRGAGARLCGVVRVEPRVCTEEINTRAGRLIGLTYQFAITDIPTAPHYLLYL
jgi:hypothetical protein